MALREMLEAHENMVQGRKKPAVWLVSPPALAKLLAESSQTATAPLMGLPIQEMPRWSFGWELLDTHRAARRGIQLD